jgi:hypothetical protein
MPPPLNSEYLTEAFRAATRVGRAGEIRTRGLLVPNRRSRPTVFDSILARRPELTASLLTHACTSMAGYYGFMSAGDYKALGVAKARLEAAVREVTHNRNPSTISAFEAVQAEFRRAGRAYAKVSGEEYAVGFDFDPRWDVGAPLPHVISSSNVTWLVYMTQLEHPEFGGTSPISIDPTSEHKETLAAVEFRGATFKFGRPNDEVMHGHPLYEKGLELYGAHIVHNSRWIQELQRINSVHGGYNPAAWLDIQHYLFLFHDETFECVARSYRVETHQTGFSDLLKELAIRLG